MPQYQVVLVERATGTEVLAVCRPATSADRRRIRWYGFDWTVYGEVAEVYKVSLPRSRPIWPQLTSAASVVADEATA